MIDDELVMVKKELCQEILKKLRAAKKRMSFLNKRKISGFSKPAFYHSEMGPEMSEVKLNGDFLSVNSGFSGLNLDKNESFTGHKDDEFLNDDLLMIKLNNEFDDYLSELTTWNDYLKAKLDLDEIESRLNSLVNKILELHSMSSLNNL